jgi:hypothetical protein
MSNLPPIRFVSMTMGTECCRIRMLAWRNSLRQWVEARIKMTRLVFFQTVNWVFSDDERLDQGVPVACWVSKASII